MLTNSQSNIVLYAVYVAICCSALLPFAVVSLCDRRIANVSRNEWLIKMTVVSH